VALSTEVDQDLPQADAVDIVCDNATVPPFQVAPQADEPVRRFRVKAHKKHSYTATASFSNGATYLPGTFDPDPPAQLVKLRKTP
jgi:hypothetical protein